VGGVAQLSRLVPALLPMLQDYVWHGAGLAPAVQAEAVKGAVLLSDFFRDQTQFEWLRRTCVYAMAAAPLAAHGTTATPVTATDVGDDAVLLAWAFIGYCKVRPDTKPIAAPRPSLPDP
jgi:hypothetical protein